MGDLFAGPSAKENAAAHMKAVRCVMCFFMALFEQDSICIVSTTLTTLIQHCKTNHTGLATVLLRIDGARDVQVTLSDSNGVLILIMLNVCVNQIACLHLRYPQLLAEPRLDNVNRRRCRTWMEEHSPEAKAFFDEFERKRNTLTGEPSEPDGWAH